MRTLDALFVSMLKKVVPEFYPFTQSNSGQVGEPKTVGSETYGRELHVAVGSLMSFEPFLEPLRP